MTSMATERQDIGEITKKTTTETTIRLQERPVSMGNKTTVEK